jgi:molybdate transport system substrate-binding protein
MRTGTAPAGAGIPPTGGRGRLQCLALAAACLVGLDAAADELLVAAAVSLREPLTEIATRYSAQDEDAGVRLTFGASSALAAQVRAGAPVDLLVSADERILDDLQRQGLLDAGSRVVIASNRLVVLVAEGLGIPIEGPDDLTRPEVRRVAAPEFAVPVGRYAREWLRRRGLLERLAPRLIPTEHARATLAAVDHGQADVAIVYATDARLARSARIAFEVPDAEQPRIVYAAALVQASTRIRPAHEFLTFLTSRAARDALRAAGFVPPRDPV